MCYDVRGAKQRWDFLRFLLFTVSGLCMDPGQNMILESREVEMNAADTKKRLITAGLILLMAAESVTMVSAASADQSAGADQTAHTAETQAPASETEDSSADKIVGMPEPSKTAAENGLLGQLLRNRAGFLGAGRVRLHHLRNLLDALVDFFLEFFLHSGNCLCLGTHNH